jgi:FixJ family two-component response regulator
LAILDVKMPVTNGFGLYNKIRKVDEKIKICFLTTATDVYYEVFRKERVLTSMKISLFRVAVCMSAML